VTLSKYGWSRDEEFQPVRTWLSILLNRYANDSRPFVLPVHTTGEVIVAWGDEEEG
jgi:hypothetical protein